MVFLCGPCRDVISKGQSSVESQFCTGIGEERTSAGGKGIAIVRSRYLARTSEDTTN
jgi:hypothetical protein